MRCYAFMIFGLALTSASASAADMSATCPLRLPGNVVKPDQPVEGWIVSVAEQMHLSASGMMAGAPETKTYLVPQKQTKDTHTYRFDPGDRERWFWCAYGGAGGVELAHRLDDKATICIITNKTKKPENTLSATVQCK